MFIIAYNCFMPEEYKKNIYYILTALLLLSGLFLRILFYAYGRPFWNDEAALAINLTDKNFLELFLPLVHEQVTPPLYAIICKFCSLFITKAEYAHRLPALVCGIFSLPLFWILAEKTLNNKIAKIFAVMLFALNYQLIYYSQELKQYSCDVLLFLGILVSYFYLENKNTSKKMLAALSYGYAISMWFSYTSVFAIFIVFLLCCIKKTGVLKRFTFPALSLVGLVFFVKNYTTDAALHSFWDNGFISADFSNFAKLIFNNMIFYFTDFNWKLFIVIVFAAGVFYCLKNLKTPNNFILILPATLALGLSYFHIYPMYTRTALYLLPVVFLIMAKTFDFRFFEKKAGAFTAGILTIIFTIFVFKTDFIQVIQKKYYRETTPQLLALYLEKAKNTDILVIPHLSAINYEYYSKKTNLNNKNVIIIKPELYEYDRIKTIYDTLPKASYYVLLTHSGDKKLELENLKKYAMSQKNFQISADGFDNALIYFQRQ